jgi:NADPH-dependent stearoyl-CoA 9-desaturase
MMAQPRPADPDPAPAATDDAERLRRFGAAIDALRARVEAQVGEEDVRYIRRVDRFSRAMEVTGRVLLHISLDPVTFAAGVVALWIHKQLQATEVGHTALHGAFDGLPGAEGLQSKSFHWQVPIDEESWRHGHNVRHHQYTNVAGRDPDIHFGPVRLTEHTPHHWTHKLQLPFTLLAVFPNFGFLMNLHFTGINDYWFGNGRGGMDLLPDRSRATAIQAHRRALRKYLPYYAREYLLFPLLAGPLFWKVLLGNWLSEVMRDVYSAATIYCGHVGGETAAYPEGTKARGRGAWYAMQVEATNNFEVPRLVSILCGALDTQIEHHLFPKLPTNRLREIAPHVRRVCDEHGVKYRSDSWPRTLWKSFRHIARLSSPRDVIGAAA